MKSFKALLFIVLSLSLVFAETHDAHDGHDHGDHGDHSHEEEAHKAKVTKDGDFTLEDGVYVLTQDNFASALEKFEYILVEFYAPWCGHCQRLAPEYAAAAEKLAETKSNIKLAKVDATENNDLGDKYEVQGYPTLKFFTKGSETPVDFTGGRTSNDILNWVNRRSGSVSSEVKSVEEVENYINSSDALALFVGTSSTSHFDEFVKAVLENDNIVVINSNEDAVKEKYGAQEGSLIIFNSKGEEKHVFEGTPSVDSYREFVDANQYPAVSEFNQAAVMRIFQQAQDAILLLKAKNDAGETAEKIFRNAAKDLKSEIIFSIANFDEDLGGRAAEFLGVAESELPTVRIVQPGNGMKKFRPEGELSEDVLRQFVKDLKAGNLKPFLKSADLPAEPYENNVAVVVSKTWESIVLDKTKDVLVELYAPWCGHCKGLAPIWESLATNIKETHPNVVIAKMDATANEVEGMEVEGFPTIKLYKKDDKENPIEFDRNREEKDFIRFLKKHEVIPKDGTEEASDVLPSGEFDWPGNWNGEGDAGHDDHDHAGHDHDHDHDHSHDHHDHAHDHHHEDKKKADEEL